MVIGYAPGGAAGGRNVLPLLKELTGAKVLVGLCKVNTMALERGGLSAVPLGKRTNMPRKAISYPQMGSGTAALIRLRDQTAEVDLIQLNI